MAAAVLSPLAGLSLDHEIMPPSPLNHSSTRHGRAKHGGSVVKKARGRGYSVVEEREVLITKAVVRALKRTAEAGEEPEEGVEKLLADADGWVRCESLLQHPLVEPLQVTFSELQTLVISPTSKARLSLEPSSDDKGDEDSDESNYLIRINPITTTQTAPSDASEKPELTPLTTITGDLPDLIVYETSYANYPLILANGGIKRAGGQVHLSFACINVQEDGTEQRRPASGDADVSIYIDIRAQLAVSGGDKTTWFRTENGNVVTEGDSEGEVKLALWKKVVARRADIGVLFEDGVAKKEVPVGLRGKGAKPKKGGKAKAHKGGLKELKARSEDEETASD